MPLLSPCLLLPWPGRGLPPRLGRARQTGDAGCGGVRSEANRGRRGRRGQRQAGSIWTGNLPSVAGSGRRAAAGRLPQSEGREGWFRPSQGPATAALCASRGYSLHRAQPSWRCKKHFINCQITDPPTPPHRSCLPLIFPSSKLEQLGAYLFIHTSKKKKNKMRWGKNLARFPPRVHVDLSGT